DSGANMIQNLSLDTEENFKNSTYTIERLARLDAGNRPIAQRLDIHVLDTIFTKQLRQRGVQSHPQLGVLKSDSTTTKVATSEFNIKDREYTIPIFYDNNDKPQYLLTT